MELIKKYLELTGDIYTSLISPIKKLISNTAILILIAALIIPFLQVVDSNAQNEMAFIRQVRVMEADEIGVVNPAGLTFSSKANAFNIAESRQMASSPGALVKLTALAERAGAVQVGASLEKPINMTFDNHSNRLLLLNIQANQLLEVRPDNYGNLNSRTVIRSDAKPFHLQDPQGMTVDEETGALFILDAATPRIIQVQPLPDGSFDGATFSEIDLQSSGFSAVRGIAIDPLSHHLFLLNPAEQKLYELTQAGQLMTTRDVSPFQMKDPQAMLFAPSGDQTDDPAQMNLYVADSGLNQEVNQSAGVSNEGQIVELSLSPAVEAAAATFTSSLVKTTDMSAISPPSPDPSGITYLPNSQTLLIVDGEVEETVSGITHFQGANVWELRLSGSKARTTNISKVSPTAVPMTNEPTGVAWNPNNGHYYVTDDDGKRVYDLNPGGDKVIGTSDDTWTSFSTSGAGSGDPEGITFNTQNGHIYVADGVNAEVYEFTTSGSLVTHFDVNKYGVSDPESVEFNADGGTLFTMSSNKSTPVIVETTLSGALLQTINISVTNAAAAAGLAFAPASDGSGVKRFYVVDRGIDNNTDPKIVDGKMYELTAPTTGATATPTNTPAGGSTATPTRTFTPTTTPSGSDLIFANGFESGNFTGWSASATNSGNLSVSANAALEGSYGLQVNFVNTTTMYVRDDTPNAEPRYRARFYFDPNSISMSTGAYSYLLQAYDASGKVIVFIQFNKSSTGYQIRARAYDSGSATYVNTAYVNITDAVHFVEFDWGRDGHLNFWVDGVQHSSLTGINNSSQAIESVRLGAPYSAGTTISGQYYLDAFESRRQTYIGALSTSGATATPINTPTPTNTPVGGPTATPTNTPGGPTATPTATASSSDIIFANGFESGNFTGWSASATNGGNLSVSSSAALVGSYGLQVNFVNTTAMYVRDDSPAAETRYRARFYFNPNSISMAAGNYAYLLQAYDSTGKILIFIQFNKSSTGYQIRARAYDSGSAAYVNTAYVDITNAVHVIELDWGGDGHLTLWLDGAQKASLTGLNNSAQTIESVRLGAPYSAGTAISGRYYIDAFESRRQSYIGP